MFASKRSSGPHCAKSKALPCATPTRSGISTNTMSPSSLAAAQWAQVAPTFPAPMIEILARRIAVAPFFVESSNARRRSHLWNRTEMARSRRASMIGRSQATAARLNECNKSAHLCSAAPISGRRACSRSGPERTRTFDLALIRGVL